MLPSTGRVSSIDTSGSKLRRNSRNDRTVKLVGKQCTPSRNTSTIVVPPGKIITTTIILVDEPCPKPSLRYAKARESLSRSFLNFDIHPFNLHDFGFERILSNEELSPWKFDYLGVT
ncbi:hypothetical protein Tco_0741140 [Tanacetum coccineum]